MATSSSLPRASSLHLLLCLSLSFFLLCSSSSTSSTRPSLHKPYPSLSISPITHRKQSLPSPPSLLNLLSLHGGGNTNTNNNNNNEGVRERISSRKGQWGTRVLSTIALLAVTAAITAVGQRKGLELIVVSAQAGAYHEVASLLDKGLNLNSGLPTRWLWFLLAFNTGHNWAYGEKLMPSLLPSWLQQFYWPRRRLIQYLAYVGLLGGSITPKGPGEMLKRQMAHLAGLHFALFLIVGLGSGYVAILKQLGIRPFLLSVLLVVVNDICAYLVGVPFGKTPLTKLSPKKSWEGFLGAAGLTILSAPGIVRLLRACVGSVPEDELFAFGSLRLSDWQALVLAAFASFGAPLGGILASGAKRAVDLKDFGKLVPGHGGVMDRVDCQLFMSAFSYLFLSSSSMSLGEAAASGAAGR